MANKKKVKIEEQEIVNVVANDTVEDSSVADENAALKAKIAEQEKQMADMMAQLKVMMQAQAATNAMATEEKVAKSIKFISLVPGGLTLKGNRMYHIDKQFAYKLIPEAEARAIVSNMPNTIASGMVYIADMDFVTKCDLDGVYEEILNDKQLKELLAKNPAEIIDIFRNAGAAQKQIIVDMVSNKRLNGEYVDANVVVELGRVCGKNLMEIEPEEEEVK